MIEKDLKDNIHHIKQLIDSIYESASNLDRPIQEDEIIIDFTGGQKPTTAGAILAGIKPGRRMQFISSDYKDGKPINSKPVEIDVSYQVKLAKQN